jgi:putative flippase GtrA
VNFNIFAHKNISDKKSIQIPRFILVGGLTASLDFIFLFVLTEFMNVNYLVAAAIGFVTGSSVNYVLSIQWVFARGKYHNYAVEFGIFTFFTVLGLLLNQVTMYVCTSIFAWLYLYSKSLSVILVTLFNFVAKKYLVFKK